MNRTLLLVLFTLLSYSCYSQDHQPMPDQIETIKSKGRTAIIRMALHIIEQQQPALALIPEDFEISVWANSKEVLVKFRRLIRYSRKDQHLEYDLSVNVGNKRIAPFDDWFYQGNFFVPTKEEQEVIYYLRDLLDLPFQGMENTISEDTETYFVNCTSKTAFCIHHIDKKTGEQLAPLEGSFAVLPEGLIPAFPEKEEEDPFIEIKD